MIVKDNGGNYENPPPGMHNAVCYRVIDLGTHESEYQGQKTVKRELMISWEIDEIMSDGRPFAVSAFYTASLNQKSKLRPMLESWRGKAFTEEELKGFNLKNVLGKPCMVNLTSSENGRVKVSSVSPLAKGLLPLTSKNELQHFDLENVERSVYQDLSEGLKKKIAESPEYKCFMNGGAMADVANNHDLDDEIPF